MPVPSRIQPKSSKSVVQECMNISVGKIYWVEQNSKWQNLLEARNNFVKERLQRSEGLSVEQFKQLETNQRRYRVGRLESAFTEDFFNYTRDGGWMAEAVGEEDRWIHIEGISRWHVKWALHAIENSNVGPGSPADAPTDLASSPAPPFFDPVKTSATENAR